MRVILALGCVLLLPAAVIAQTQLPAPWAVPGKEYSTNLDTDGNGGLDHLQTLGWDGLGNIWDSWDETGPPPPDDPDEVDALASNQDSFFFQVRDNQVPFVISLQGEGSLRYHTTTGQTGIWAQPTDLSLFHPPDEVDGLELYEGSTRYSIYVDALPLPSGTSIYCLGGSTYLDHVSLQLALQAQSDVDLDALMVFDIENNETFDPGDWIIFSLHPGPQVTVQGVTSLTDGGELFVWQNGQPISYLVHGGRTWDTANPVAQIFGSVSENIDALDAVVPEPGALSLLASLLVSGGLALLIRRRRTA